MSANAQSTDCASKVKISDLRIYNAQMPPPWSFTVAAITKARTEAAAHLDYVGGQ